ncbi:CysRS [Symbiodinium natans]|uniref:cysteine--tRNA ligase n=1 Tax=Symbiodinium natans TaxID=878477 RepID=A0A812J2K3_9DINO|nr:CysRS [Symbiodinium natans]
MDAGYLKKVGLDIRSGPAVGLGRTDGRSNGTASPKAPAAESPSPTAKSSFGKDLLGKGFERSAVTKGSHPPWLVPNAGHNAGLQVMNSLTGEKEPFRPLQDKKVIWYTCGPTVYDVAHMGHARAYLTFDILRRIMVNYLGFDVKYQINITDIDDKIILRARQNKLFDDFSKEAAKMKLDELKQVVNTAVDLKGKKLEKKAPEKPAADAPAKDQQEYTTSLSEHELKLGQHKELQSKIQAAFESGKSSLILATARDVLMEKLDKERGHTVSDHSIFDAHGRHFEKEYFEDMDALGILRPDVVTRITEYMDGRVQKFIEKLEEMGVAYGSAGSVYFDIASFQKMGYHYRKLVPALCATAKEMEEGEGALAAEDAEKRSPNDFALWKKSKPGEPAWDSKWGPGRPGWHIECSVMATDINGEYLDIHAGGEDLKFPHHDNEMAQSEAYLQRSQWVNYFWHAGHLHIEGLKMSKSLKNFITIRQALGMHSARQLRMMFLMQAWDKGMNYSDQAIDMAKVEERRVKHFLGSLDFWLRQPHGQKPSDKEAKIEAAVASCKDTIHAALLDNFATPRVIEALSKLVVECKVAFESLPDLSLEPLVKAAQLVESTLSMLGVEGLRIVREPKEAWTKSVDAFADLRQSVRDFAKEKDAAKRKKLIEEAAAKAAPSVATARSAGLKELADALDSFQKDVTSLAGEPPAKLLPRCDQVRDVDLVRLGVRLEDRGNEGYVWMFEQRETLEAEQKEAEEKAKEAAQQKIRNKLDQKEKELRVAEKAAVAPKDLFQNGSNKGVYAEFDAEGVPTKLASGEEVSAKKKKDLAKELAKQQKDFEKLQKQAGEAGIDAFLAKMRSEVEEMKKQLR